MAEKENLKIKPKTKSKKAKKIYNSSGTALDHFDFFLSKYYLGNIRNISPK